MEPSFIGLEVIYCVQYHQPWDINVLAVMGNALHYHQQIPLEEAVKVVGEEVNNKIHQQLGNFLSQDQFDYRTINFDRLVESIDPHLWRLITIITRSKKTTQDTPWTTANAAYTHKKDPIILLPMLCANNRCSMPVHVLLTDIIKAGGGSSESMRILNRFGAVACEETHNRLVVCHRGEKK